MKKYTKATTITAAATDDVLEGVMQAAAMIRVVYLKQKGGVVTGRELDSAA